MRNVQITVKSGDGETTFVVSEAVANVVITELSKALAQNDNIERITVHVTDAPGA